MIILVTGGAGFIGSNLCTKLLDQGHQVIAVDNFISSSQNNLKELKKNPYFKFYQLDVTQKNFLRTIVKNYSKLDQIYHLACPTGVPNCLTLAEEMIDACSFGTKQTLQLALHFKATVVIASTAEVYGNPQIFPQTESYQGNVSTTDERSAYEEGKRFTETLVALFVRKYGLQAKIARLFNAYGPYMSTRDTRVHPQMIQQALSNKPVTVYGNGQQTRTFCFITDTINGLLSIMERGLAGETYNVGNDQPTKIFDLAKLIINLSGSYSDIKFVPHFIADHHGRLPNIEKITALGWQKNINLETGTKILIDYFRENRPKY